ncbi:hypothetical protein THAOC_18514, partial [Thalassiosira oceanica]
MFFPFLLAARIECAHLLSSAPPSQDEVPPPVASDPPREAEAVEPPDPVVGQAAPPAERSLGVRPPPEVVPPARPVLLGDVPVPVRAAVRGPVLLEEGEAVGPRLLPGPERAGRLPREAQAVEPSELVLAQPPPLPEGPLRVRPLPETDAVGRAVVLADLAVPVRSAVRGLVLLQEGEAVGPRPVRAVGGPSSGAGGPGGRRPARPGPGPPEADALELVDPGLVELAPPVLAALVVDPAFTSGGELLVSRVFRGKKGMAFIYSRPCSPVAEVQGRHPGPLEPVKRRDVSAPRRPVLRVPPLPLGVLAKGGEHDVPPPTVRAEPPRPLGPGAVLVVVGGTVLPPGGRVAPPPPPPRGLAVGEPSREGR